MKNTACFCAVVLPWLLFLSSLERSSEETVHCQWGPFDDWSECDGCTKLQTRSRRILVYAQFGRNPCDGDRTETRSCDLTKGCPLADGCGNRFRCRSGKCVSRSLLCNGDLDCDDGDDEHDCDHTRRYITCLNDELPPNIELLGTGFDVVSGMSRGSVINTKSFGGQCRSIYSGFHNALFRLPLSTSQLRFKVDVQTDFSEEMFTSEWHYAKEMSARRLHHRGLHPTRDMTQEHKMLVSKTVMEVAQFQADSPHYIPLTESFWKALAQLPLVYNYAAYRKLLETFGTHYFSEGSLGGVVTVFAVATTETQSQKVPSWGFEAQQLEVEGGDVRLISAVQKDDNKAWDVSSEWTRSLRSFPKVIKPKLMRLSELVKEVPCAELKRFNLDRALEEYLSESDACHCRPCRNNGLAFMEEGVCKCICKSGTSGLACENGSDVKEIDVTDGSWSCWSAWSTCAGGQKSRSRSCSNPAPQDGGQACKGDGTETTFDCDHTEHFKISEPQCLEPTAPVKPTCGTPPALINGYILEPKDVYVVGSEVEYNCTSRFHLFGQNILECNANQKWSGRPGLCNLPRCKLRSLAHDIIVRPLEASYGIGETVTLSCPAGSRLMGHRKIVCDNKLKFSPDPENFECIEVIKQQQQQQRQLRFPRSTRCERWEKPAGGQCVCKMPFECRSSLEVCATDVASGRSVVVSVCKLHTLRCMHINYKLAPESVCKWPQRNTTSGCNDCQMWETCDEHSGECRCKDHAECLTPGFEVCVRTGEDALTRGSMSECEAGLRRCKGEKVSVVDILPCDS
ncbi:complement component C7 isoform X1 [Phyllopteryx taeniolatus]|uniref:complement component C7 isoform X1 n=1 Tax=Phyllopteryx taeniolatus TaxID=161469 RepID=UPI002AD21A1C|nr:complement component C7 isoform X1 [Phyllopteryx taeniolatus]